MKTIKTCVTALISALLVFSPVAYADKRKTIKARRLRLIHMLYQSWESQQLYMLSSLLNLLEQKLMLLIRQQVTCMRKLWYHFKLVKLRMISFLEAMVPFQAGQAPYDIVFGFSNFINDWRRYLEPVPKKYVEMKQMISKI